MGRADGVKTHVRELLADNCLDQGNRDCRCVGGAGVEGSRIGGLNLTPDDPGNITSVVGTRSVGTGRCRWGVGQTGKLLVDTSAFSEFQAATLFYNRIHRRHVVEYEQVEGVIGNAFEDVGNFVWFSHVCVNFAAQSQDVLNVRDVGLCGRLHTAG